jgi:hypothetical protein
MLARVHIGYAAAKIVADLSRDNYEALRLNVWGLKLEEWKPDQEKPPAWYHYATDTIIDTATDMIWLARFQIPHEVKEFKNTYMISGKDEVGNTVNINIALPNIGLLVIDEVTWLDDACTEALQDKLTEGWRILAVCPPNGTRRPDYILGRTKGLS